MSLALIVALVVAGITAGWIYAATHKLSIVFVHVVLLSLTPWWLTLLFAQPSLKSPLPTPFKLGELKENSAFYTSFEFIFFSGDRRPLHGIPDHGMFLPSFIPFIAFGAAAMIKRKSSYLQLVPLWWLIIGVLISVGLSSIPTGPGSIWFLPSLSLLATSGVWQLGSILTHKASSKASQVFLIGVLSWLAYEAIRLHYILYKWQPFSL